MTTRHGTHDGSCIERERKKVFLELLPEIHGRHLYYGVMTWTWNIGYNESKEQIDIMYRFLAFANVVNAVFSNGTGSRMSFEWNVTMH